MDFGIFRRKTSLKKKTQMCSFEHVERSSDNPNKKILPKIPKKNLDIAILSQKQFSRETSAQLNSSSDRAAAKIFLKRYNSSESKIGFF